MSLNNHAFLLTFEWDAKREMLEIHGNQDGLEKLQQIIDLLLKKKNPDHVHLMTTDWGGNELSNEKQNSENVLINHVKIFKWPD